MKAPSEIPIYHITDLANLRGIVDAGGIRSDVAMAAHNPAVIGYDHIKLRRATEIRVDCCGDRFVGEFVPFYYCPRSPMLYTINLGNTGRPVGCQSKIVHLVSTVGDALAAAQDWAISDGNAGAFHGSFYKDLAELGKLDWEAIHARIWQGRTHQKAAEFLVADFFPWNAVRGIGCMDATAAAEVNNILGKAANNPVVSVERTWYY